MSGRWICGYVHVDLICKRSKINIKKNTKVVGHNMGEQTSDLQPNLQCYQADGLVWNKHVCKQSGGGKKTGGKAVGRRSSDEEFWSIRGWVSPFCIPPLPPLPAFAFLSEFFPSLRHPAHTTNCRVCTPYQVEENECVYAHVYALGEARMNGY